MQPTNRPSDLPDVAAPAHPAPHTWYAFPGGQWLYQPGERAGDTPVIHLTRGQRYLHIAAMGAEDCAAWLRWHRNDPVATQDAD